jgi:hypothetical protein
LSSSATVEVANKIKTESAKDLKKVFKLIIRMPEGLKKNLIVLINKQYSMKK